MTGDFGWTIYARNPDGTREGVIEDYIQAELKPVYCDVGTWSIRLNGHARFAAELTQPKWGIIVVRDGVTILSGPMKESSVELSVSDDGDEKYEVDVSGITDENVLKVRLVSPSPTEEEPPYDVQASDDQTGVASTVIAHYVDVNCGPGATSDRRTPGFTLASDPVLGASVSAKGRWDLNVLSFIQPLAVTGQIGFRVVQTEAGREFQTYVPTDRTDTVKFAVGLGNLSGFTYKRSAPETNYAYVGASGTGLTRIIKEFPDSDSLAQWGRIEGPLVDQRGTSDPAQLQVTANEAFAQNGEQVGLTITPLETETMRFGEHYFLGDKVTVQLDQSVPTPYEESGQILDILRSVTIVLDDKGQTVTPAIGTVARTDVSRLFRKYVDITKRVNNIERQ
jgi:hypothetical protein